MRQGPFPREATYFTSADMPKRKKLNVAIVRGGFSNEREVSLKSGAQIARALPAERYNVSLIEIKKNGRWILGGRKKSVAAYRNLKTDFGLKEADIKKFDVVFIGLHGAFGEDGKIQALLETIGVPYTGSGVLASALGMNKAKTMEIAARAGMRVPPFIVLYRFPRAKDETRELRRRIKKTIAGYPLVVKPNESGSSVGITIVQSPVALRAALRAAFKECRTVLLQQYVKGRELTCGVMGNTGRGPLLPLPPVEIIPDGTFFDYRSKYNSKKTRELCPAPIFPARTKELQRRSVGVHALIGCDGLTRSDFILGEDGALYFLEINTIPGLTEASLCPKEARAMGWTFSEFIQKQIELALARARF